MKAERKLSDCILLFEELVFDSNDEKVEIQKRSLFRKHIDSG